VRYLSLIYSLSREKENTPIDICSLIGCWSTCQQANKHDEMASSLFHIVISICAIIDLLLSNKNKSAIQNRIAASIKKLQPKM
jgi:hypothetical protein